MRLIVGLIGRIASGKSIVADHLVKEHGASYYRFSDVLRDMLLRLQMPNTRENLQNMGLALRRLFGDGILAEALKADIEEDGSGLIVVDGIRYQDEFDMVKDLGGVILHVTSPERVRYERVLKRATRGEAEISFEEFKRNEDKETERLIDELGENSDHTIENNGTIDGLKRQVEDFVRDNS
ncbi:MAG: AAA family ATPase [Candidatus Altiarchaeales archaeon]|nr:AAA family ATPase [Candidatus Altiarchaeales archaeon]MBD3416231.1 AAA family ATPase [Candidatus Altiarchaeales archaeon]